MPFPWDHLLGRAGQHAVIAEFLRRGYNVALPEVDLGDDFLVLDGRPGGFSRIQVKTSSTVRLKTEWGFQAQFFIPGRQLVTPQRPKLFFVLAARLADEERDAAIVEEERDRGRRGGGRGGSSRRGGGGRAAKSWSQQRSLRGESASANILSPATDNELLTTDNRPPAADDWLSETEPRWEFLVIARKTLLTKHRQHGFGTFADKRVMLGVTFRRGSVTGYGADLEPFRNNFARYWPARGGGD